MQFQFQGEMKVAKPSSHSNIEVDNASYWLDGYLAMDPSTVSVLLIPLDAHLKLEFSAGRALQEGGEEKLASSQPEEGLLENISLLLS